jgi:hypothetical protein
VEKNKRNTFMSIFSDLYLWWIPIIWCQGSSYTAYSPAKWRQLYM